MYLIIIFFIILLGRVNSSILGYQLLNTDEFIIGAKAHRIVNSKFNIAQFDGDTSGVLNALFLTWPSILDFDVTYLSIRLTSITIISLISYITFKTINLFVNKNLSIFLILPTVLFFSLSKDPDFLHYTNELISTLLLTMSLFFYFKNFQNIKKLQIFFISSLLGLVIFAKMQFFPIACIIVFLFNIRLLFIEKNYKNVFFSISGFIFPILLFLLYYYLNNELIDLYYNVIHFPLSDLITRNGFNDTATIYPKNNLSSILSSEKKSLFYKHLSLNSVFHLFYFYFTLIILFLIFNKINNFKIKTYKIFLDFKAILISIIIIFTFIIIIITGAVHRHYLINLIPFISIYLAILFKFYKLNEQKIYFKKFKKYLFLLFGFFLISLLFENKKFYSNNFKQETFLNNKTYFYNPDIFQYLNLNKNKDKIIIWGWKPELYLLSGLVPSTRETVNQKQIDYKSNREYFRDRFIKDFKKNKPSILIDYVKVNSNFFRDPKTQGVKSFSELNNELKKDYIKITSQNNNCPDMYLKNENYVTFNENRINYSINYEDNLNIIKIDDLNIDEEICDTSFLFNEKSSDDLVLNLNTKKNIKQIKILSSKKNYKKVNIEIFFFRDEKLLNKIETKLNKFPHWTNISFNENKEVSKILINIKELKKNNFGLNEIKIF